MAEPDRLPKPDLRVGDAERDKASAALGEHFAAGRLTPDEHDERLTSVWNAKTYGELGAIFRDLPDPGPENLPAVPPKPPEVEAKRQHRRQRPQTNTGQLIRSFAPLLLVLAFITVVTVPWHPWPLFILVWFLIGAAGRSHHR
jgi:hypothetical protein